MNTTDEELIQDRIQNLWHNTDFSATLFEVLVGYAVVAADFDGNIIAYNEGARQIYGYASEEMVGKQPIDVLFPRAFLEAGFFHQAIDFLLTTGRFSYEGVKVRKDGDCFPAQILFTLTKDKTGKLVGFVEIVQDLTERKRAEEELRLHRDHLEVLVHKRTAELANTNEALQTEISHRKRVEAELREQAQELAEADRRKNEFLAMLAHELRNPLAPILTSLHLMRQPGAAGPTVQHAQGVAERQVRHLSRIVDDLLDVSRITRGKVQLRKEVVTLDKVVAGAVETARPFIANRRHDLSVALAPEPIGLQADPTRLEQVLVNLLHNAAKYTEPGGRIWLTAERDHNDIVLRVRDSGIGIAPEVLPRIFDLFAQADSSLDRSQGGLGIGLTLVKSLVEMHGGSVQAFSTGQGSEFVVRLPALPPHLTRVPTSGDSGKVRGGGGSVATEDVKQAPVPAASRRRILVVDDNADLAESLAVVLQLAGHEVQVAHDGPAALAAAQTYQPEVVFLDIGLPKMDGYQVAVQLRHQAVPKLLLVAMTGYGEDKDRCRSREAGFDLHLVKPVDPSQVIELVARSN